MESEIHGNVRAESEHAMENGHGTALDRAEYIAWARWPNATICPIKFTWSIVQWPPSTIHSSLAPGPGTKGSPIPLARVPWPLSKQASVVTSTMGRVIHKWCKVFYVNGFKLARKHSVVSVGWCPIVHHENGMCVCAHTLMR